MTVIQRQSLDIRSHAERDGGGAGSAPVIVQPSASVSPRMDDDVWDDCDDAQFSQLHREQELRALEHQFGNLCAPPFPLPFLRCPWQVVIRAGAHHRGEGFRPAFSNIPWGGF